MASITIGNIDIVYSNYYAKPIFPYKCWLWPQLKQQYSYVASIYILPNVLFLSVTCVLK